MVNKFTPKTLRACLLISGVDEKSADMFINWLKDNRAVWDQFEKYTLEANRAKKKLGAKAIIERCRWETEIENQETYKCNNNYTAYLARLFNLKYDVEYFDLRTTTGLKNNEEQIGCDYKTYPSPKSQTAIMFPTEKRT